MKLNEDNIIRMIRPYFKQQAIERGWNHFINGQVFADFSSRTTVVGEVLAGEDPQNGEMRAEVRFDRLESSYCSCSSHGFCEHMAAIIFEAMEMLGLDPEQFYSPTVNGLRAISGGKAAGQQEMKPSKIHKPQVPAPQETDKPAAWFDYYESCFTGPRLNHPNELQTLFERASAILLPAAQGWRTEKRALYQLSAALFILNLVTVYQRAFKETPYYYYYQNSRSYIDLASECMQLVIAALDEVDVEQVHQHYSEELNEIAAYLHWRAFDKHEASSLWLDMYAVVWMGWLLEDARLGEEKERLQAVAAGTIQESKQHSNLVHSLALFLFLEAQDEEAALRLEEAGRVNLGYVMRMLGILESSLEWERLVHWLRWLRPYMEDASTQLIDLYFRLWDEVSEKLDIRQELLKTMTALRSRCYTIYMKRLYDRGDYKEWVDWQMQNGATPLEFRVSMFKPIEQADMALLLPWYHQGVEFFVMQKNRSAYKAAVKLLKRLHSMYKKLKREEDWQRYIELFSGKYTRLRAFQEELRRGKLIT